MENIDVAIIMGSDSDLDIMKDAAKFLENMGISYEMKILSVHRTPEKATLYAEELKKRNVKVIIGGARWRCSFTWRNCCFSSCSSHWCSNLHKNTKWN